MTTPTVAAGARRPFRLAITAAIVFLAATADERFLGIISDEQQMLSTASAIATWGEVGISRDFMQRTDRPGGDAASWYGLAQPLVEVPAIILSGPWERHFGRRSSQTLFVLTEIVLIVLAAAAAGQLARAAGASPGGEVVAVLGTAVASPLATYASTMYSEPLQAAVLAGAAATSALAARAVGGRADRLAACAGLLAGVSVLAKVTNLAAAPFVLLPLLLDRAEALDRRALRRVLIASAGALPPLALWVAGEISRFGGLFRTYAKDGFCHPVLDGAWRLLAAPNKGLFLYFPLSLAALLGTVILARRPGTRGTGLGVAGVFAVLLATSARWWWWDGTVGFGPRFLVPAVPLLAAAAGAVLPARGAARAATWGLLAAGAAVNALGLLQSDTVTTLLIDRSNPVTLTATEKARLPKVVLANASALTGRFSRTLFKGDDADFGGIRLHARLLAIRLTTAPGREREEALRGFPWSPRHPPLEGEIGISPPETPAAAAETYLLGPFRWPVLFRALSARGQDRTFEFNAAWQMALADQVARSLDAGEWGRAERLASKLLEFAPTAGTSAYLAESLRLQSKRGELDRFLASLPGSTLGTPPLLAVRALVARDDGLDELARALLADAARGFRSRSLERALAAPPATWPGYRDLAWGRFGAVP